MLQPNHIYLVTIQDSTPETELFWMMLRIWLSSFTMASNQNSSVLNRQPVHRLKNISDESLPAIKLACGGDRNSLWCKTQEAFKYIYAKHGFGTTNHTMWGVHSVAMLCYVFFWKFR